MGGMRHPLTESDPMPANIAEPAEPAEPAKSPEPARLAATSVGIAPERWRNHFASSFAPAEPLGRFYTRLDPQGLPAPVRVARCAAMARELGLDLDWLDSDAALQAFSGNRPLPGSEPLASVYSGHQFGVWAGQLGDGRALLLGELAEPGMAADGPGWELQLKGAGLTPYSRMGDGRAVLRSSIREFLCSEALHALGVPTTRALYLAGSPLPVRRETMETAAVVTRVARSFIRFGHFEHFSYADDHTALRQLADHVIARHYPECTAGHGHGGNAYAALLQTVSERTAHLMAQWQAQGFCHGVMNTDNMSILGLTIDYGPFQFLDGFDPGHICNHSDTQGRYAYARQPNVAYWNLFCLGQALLPLMDSQDQALAALESYKTVFPQALLQRMSAKLGRPSPDFSDANAVTTRREQIDSLLRLLQADRADWPAFWRRFAQAVRDEGELRLGGASVAAGSTAPTPATAAHWASVRDLFLNRDGFDSWLLRFWEQEKPVDIAEMAKKMLKTNPHYVLRNHLAELAIRAAQAHDFGPTQRLLDVLQRPFDEQPDAADLAALPPAWASTIEISCSS